MDRNTELGELDLKVQLLAEEAGHAGDLQKRLQDKEDEIESAKRALVSKESTRSRRVARTVA